MQQVEGLIKETIESKMETCLKAALSEAKYKFCRKRAQYVSEKCGKELDLRDS